MTTHWADFDPDDIAWLYGGHCEPDWEPPRRRDVHHLPDISTYQETTVPDDYEDDDCDGEQVQCWHIEPDTPCDWNICRQPERLERGDTGTDPALGLATPNLDRIRQRTARKD